MVNGRKCLGNSVVHYATGSEEMGRRRRGRERKVWGSGRTESAISKEKKIKRKLIVSTHGSQHQHDLL